MKIKKLTLFTNQLASELRFYSETLGFKVMAQNKHAFTVQVGWSELTFENSGKAHTYHYCFLIPANKLAQALAWMEKRLDIIPIENGRKTQHFETWNADSFYFYDASGNIAECIVRYDLKNNDDADFDIAKVLGVNEIGMPTRHVKQLNDQLQSELKTSLWKGDLTRFATNGSQEGLFLIPNYDIKDTWFPTSIKITPAPFEALIDNEGEAYQIAFYKEVLKTIKISIK